MNVEYINPFLSAAVTVFEKMLGCTLIRQTPFVKRGVQPEHEISGIIGLSGKAKGTVVLSLSRDAAISATEAMLGERPKELNSDVSDAVGELTNIIAGNAKAKLESLALSISLPTVVIGKNHIVEFPRTITPICVPFDCPWGFVAVEVGFVEEPKGCAVPTPAATPIVIRTETPTPV